MAKTHAPYAPEYRQQMVELARAGRSGGAGRRVRLLGSDDSQLGASGRAVTRADETMV